MIMPKIKVKNLDNLTKQLSSNLNIELNKIFSNKTVLSEVRKIIEKNFRSKNFGSAKDSTNRQRKYLEKYNTTDPDYIPGQIKAIFTGQLLEDLIKGTVGVPTEKQFHVAHTDAENEPEAIPDRKHKGYKTKSGRTKGAAFSDIAEGLVKRGFNYFELESKYEKQLVKLISDEIEKVVKKLNR